MKMFVDTRDNVLAPHLMTDGFWESSDHRSHASAPPTGNR